MGKFKAKGQLSSGSTGGEGGLGVPKDIGTERLRGGVVNTSHLTPSGSGGPGTGQPPSLFDHFIPYSLFDAAGDILIGTGPDSADNFPIGAEGKVLKVRLAEPMKVKWEDDLEGLSEAEVLALIGSSATKPRFVSIAKWGTD
jgi:hypothetical protein